MTSTPIPPEAQRLVDLFDRPADAARAAAQIRDARGEPEIAIVGVPPRERIHAPGAWPRAADVSPGEDLTLQTEPSAAGRRAFACWLVGVAEHLPSDITVSPVSQEAAGLHRLWCIAAARIALGPSVRVLARHDLIGIRLAQLALGFGADALAGPLEAERRLPVAGMTRPNETSPTGLATLIRQAGLRPKDITP
jgi:hypothetical protein